MHTAAIQYIVVIINSNQMRVSRLHMQQTLLMLNNKKNSQEIAQEIETRCNPIINQISIFNSTFDSHMMPQMSEEMEILIIRKSRMDFKMKFEILGRGLKTVELPYCRLKHLPIINSQYLQKLNVSNNEISEILELPNKSLKLLDIRNNKIVRITKQIYNQHITILHQFIAKKHDKSIISLPLCLYPPVIEIEDIVNDSIRSWNNSELIQTCENIIENGNQVLLKQLLPYLSEEFVNKIFEIAKLKRKQTIIYLLITSQQTLILTHQQALDLLMVQFIEVKQLYKTSLSNLIKSFSNFNHQKQRVITFLDYLVEVQAKRSFFIQSEKDFINFMNLNLTYPNNFQADFLITQYAFFIDYDFSNKAILQYLVQLDNLKLFRKLLQLPNYILMMFSLGIYKKLLKPNKKIFKLLLKQDKKYLKTLKFKNDLYFPQYRQRKSFCLKNDLYDYEILSEYEQMQCSYSHKDLKFTLKFCNKENEISVAKRIQTQLKRKNVKNMLQIGKSHYSTSVSSYNS